MRSIGRIAAAFVVAPGASALTMVAVLSIIGRGLPSERYAATVAAVVYGAAILIGFIGFPSFLLFRALCLRSVAFYVGAALAVAAPLMLMAAALTGGAVLPLVAGLSAAAGGAVFYEIMERQQQQRSP